MSKLVEEYNKSDEKILFLIGPPGTGKTRFIRYLLKNFNKQKDSNKIKDINEYDYELSKNEISVLYTNDSKLLEDGVVVNVFAGNKYDFLIMEDIDLYITPRKDGGGNIIYQLLTASDGVMRAMTKDKKIVLSSNLSRVNIDEALLRSGRCFQVLDFRSLNKNEIESLILSMGKNLDQYQINNEMPLCDIYRMLNNKENFSLPNTFLCGF